MELFFDSLFEELRSKADDEYETGNPTDLRLITETYVVEAKGVASAILELFRKYTPRPEDFKRMVQDVIDTDLIISDREKSAGFDRIVLRHISPIVELCIERMIGRVENLKEFSENLDLEVLCT